MPASLRSRKLVQTLLLTLMVAGCTTTMGTGGTEQAIEDNALEVCAAWLPISWSTRDTDQTVREAKANNAARIAWGCPNTKGEDQ